MGKGILEFDLNDPDDINDHKIAVRAHDILMVLWTVDQYIRGELKYNESLPSDAYEALEKLRDELRENMANRGLSFDDLIN